jgi:ABC-2 type transport system ATP-binding protein
MLSHKCSTMPSRYGRRGRPGVPPRRYGTYRARGTPKMTPPRDDSTPSAAESSVGVRYHDEPGTGISVRGLSKRFGSVTAVRDLTFDVPAGQVTGFLGPNGAGKSTTLRMILGLVRPTSGAALVGGRRFADLAQPRCAVGAVLETTGFHPGRRGRDHLRVAARAAGLPAGRVDEVLDRVGLADAAGRRVRGYSLGMRQRLGLAAALLGDPAALILDEPANGLDPAGMAWLRGLLRGLAAEGRTVLFSSHVLSEVAQTVDHLVIVNNGALGYAGPLADIDGPLETAFLDLVGGDR